MSSSFVEDVRLLPHVVAYEWRKATAFRAGFLLREVLRGIGRPLVMTLVYAAMLRGSAGPTLGGYSFRQLVAYLVWTAILQKCLTDERSFDIAEQIFDGYITKYLVMPVSVLTLVWGRFLQFTSLQLLCASLFWIAGAVLLPGYWPLPASGLALLEASVLLLLGAACYMLAHVILNCLAFWLDVVWSLLNMFRFVTLFVSGALVPVALMPRAVGSAFAWSFPYWTVFAPAEILLGRQGTPQFVAGVCVLVLSLCGLQWLAVVTFKRGLARYAGVGA